MEKRVSLNGGLGNNKQLKKKTKNTTVIDSSYSFLDSHSLASNAKLCTWAHESKACMLHRRVGVLRGLALDYHLRKGTDKEWLMSKE